MIDADNEIVIGHNNLSAVPEFSEFDELLAELAEKYEGATYDLDDPTEEAKVRADDGAVAHISITY